MRNLQNIIGNRTILLGLVILALAWGYLAGPVRGLSSDSFIGGTLSVIVVALIGFVFLRLTLWLAGPHVLPVDLHDRHEKRAARRVLAHYALGNPTLMAVVREGKAMPNVDGKPRGHISGAGVLDVDSTSVVVLSTETGLSRIKGQGLVFTRLGEKLGGIVDLRMQARSKEFEFLTRDGILIKAGVSIRFQIDRISSVQVQSVDRAVRYPRPFTWSRHTIKKAIGLQSYGPEGAAWDDVPLGMAAGMLRSIISEYTFDALSDPHDARSDPRAEIRSRLEKQVSAALAPHGLKVFGVGVGTFFPKGFTPTPNLDRLDEITQQRVESWQAEWQSRIVRVRAEGEAESSRLREVAHAQAQMDMILKIVQAVEQSPAADDEPHNQIAQRFLQTLQAMASEPTTRTLLRSDETLLLQSLQDRLGPPKQSE